MPAETLPMHDAPTPLHTRPALLALALFGLALAPLAGARDLVKSAVDANVRVALPGARPAWAEAAADRGAVASTRPLARMTLTLKRSPERQQAFEQYLRELHDPASPNYQRWLTSAEIGERFGASEHDLAAISAWLAQQNLAVEAVAPSRQRIRFSGAAADASAAFATALHEYATPTGKRIAATQAPSVPAALADAIAAVTGLESQRVYPLHRIERASRPLLPGGAPEPAMTNCSNGDCRHFLFPADVAKIYGFDMPHASGIDGRGQSIAIVARTRVSADDLKNFRSIAKLPTTTLATIIPPDGSDPGAPATSCGGTGQPACDDEPSDAVMDQMEATMDVQLAGAAAPGATLKLVTSGSVDNADGVYIALEHAIEADPPPARIVSVSYGTCEAVNSTGAARYLGDLYAQAAMKGISVLVSSGDAGAGDCAEHHKPPTDDRRLSTNLLCSSPYVTCVGGTQFADTDDADAYWARTNGTGYASAYGYIPEGAWNEPAKDSGAAQVAATGGGISRFYPTPDWQVGPGVPAARSGRHVPDVSLSASSHNGYFMCLAALGGACKVSGGSFHFMLGAGTSASAPGMAGIAALLHQKAGGAQGNLNPRLYALAANPANGVFHDVTIASSGVTGCTPLLPSPCNNTTPGPNGADSGLKGYLVGDGYDLATGLGSPDVARLLAFWNAPGTTSATLRQRGLTGSWYNPATDGQGLELEVAPDGNGGYHLFAGWFTYDTTAAGGTRWYTIQGQVGAGQAWASLPIYLTQGGRFDTATPVQTSVVGQGTLEFSDCGHGTLAYAFNDGSGRAGMIPLARITANAGCSQDGAATTAGIAGLGGSWYEPATSGQGFVFDVAPLQNTLFAAWYTYGAAAGAASGAGGQRWYTIQGPLPASGASGSYTIYATSGGAFDRPMTTQTAAVGSATIRFHSCTEATLDYRFSAGENAGRNGSIALTRPLAPATGCTP
jgi:subtilase family serine protease